jgi:hypothetical protein
MPAAKGSASTPLGPISKICLRLKKIKDQNNVCFRFTLSFDQAELYMRNGKITSR